MTDLSAFGGGIEEDDPDEQNEEETTERQTYRNGRCSAISVGSRKGCRSPVSQMKDSGEFCGTHGRQRDPWTIHDDPGKLILITGELDRLSLVDLDPEKVEFDLERIKQAVDAVSRDRTSV